MGIPTLFKKKDPLEEALKGCKNATKQGYQEANAVLKKIKHSIEDAQDQLSQGLDEMGSTGSSQVETLNKVKKQLDIVKESFEQSYNDTKAKLESKHAKKDAFNIVLFGRTMCGKSTLMEILKHGQGESIGKGAQRTTRDIREYEWNGLTITDVPGIDSFEGSEDDVLAEEAADKADLIIFMITAGQPEATEAKWLVKLKRKDKPILCLCNYKQAITGNEHNLKHFLKTAEGNMQSTHVTEMFEQFNKFVQDNLPGERIDIYIAHLQSMFLSRKEEYSNVSEVLVRLSCFPIFERAIINYVIRYGVFNRRRSFLSVVDNPVYLQYLQLLDFSKDSYLESRHVYEAISQFTSWVEGFEEDSIKKIETCIDIKCNDIRNCISSFVEENVTASNVPKLWKEKVESFEIQKAIDSKINMIGSEAQRQINTIFSNLKTAFNITLEINKDYSLSDKSFTNWKKINGWISTGTGAIGTILALSSNPVGWAFAGVSLLFGIISWINDSREEKLRNARIELTKKLHNNVDKLCRKNKKIAVREFKESMSQTKKDTLSRLNIMWHTLSTLANSQREMAWSFCEQHCTISKAMSVGVLKELGLYDSEIEKIKSVARIPSVKSVMLTSDFIHVNNNNKCNQQTENGNIFYLMQKTLGNSEAVSTIVNFDNSRPISAQLFFLLKKYNLKLGPVQFVELKQDLKYRNVAYFKPKELTQQEKDTLNIIQQILKIQIIQRS